MSSDSSYSECTLSAVKVSRPAISALAKRLKTLESASHVSPNDQTSRPAQSIPRADTRATRNNASGPIPEEIEDTSGLPKSTNLVQGQATHNYAEAHETILPRLNEDCEMRPTRRGVLKSALEVVSQMSSIGSGLASDVEVPVDGTAKNTNPNETFRSELLYILSSDYKIQWQDHISQRKLETMILALMDRNENYQVLLQYQVCVYAKEMFRISGWAAARHDETFLKHHEQTQHYYKNMALTALKQINLLFPPTLTLVQALISGAMLMQFLGNMSQSWIMTSFAARNLTLLNYHVHTSNTSGVQEDDIKMSMAWCFYLDKVLSALFGKPPSLPKLDFGPVALTKWDNMSPVFQCMLEMASIMDRAFDLQFRCSEIEKEQSLSLIDEIIQDTYNFHGRYIMPYTSAQETQTDWIAATFCHHTMLNSFFQFRFNLFNQKEYQEKSLENAREALSILHHLQNRALESNHHSQTPLFLLVGTSNLPDLQLMQNVTDKLSPFTRTSKSAAKLHCLFTSLLDLCRPLFYTTSEVLDVPSSANNGANTSNNVSHSIPVSDGLRRFDSDESLIDSGIEDAELMPGYPGLRSGFPWGDGQMLELLSSQPCLDWLE